jgi:hypothetical protein
LYVCDKESVLTRVISVSKGPLRPPEELLQGRRIAALSISHNRVGLCDSLRGKRGTLGAEPEMPAPTHEQVSDGKLVQDRTASQRRTRARALGQLDAVPGRAVGYLRDPLPFQGARGGGILG